MMTMRGTRRRAAATLAGITLAALVVAGTQWRADGGGPDPAPEREAAGARSVARPTAGQPAAAAAQQPAAAAQPPAREAAAAPSPVLEDGRHPVFLTGLDATARTLEFDLLQYLAEVPEHEPGPECGCDDDDHLRNESSRLRTLPVAPDAAAYVQGGPGGPGWEHVAFADLPAHLGPAGGGPPEALRIDSSLFWLTVRDGTIVAIEEEDPGQPG
jgi:hypothetical protein